jgi:hypothetical protein
MLMNHAVRDCLGTGCQPLIAAVTALPDPNGRQVVAAAIRATAQVIGTAKLSDVPVAALDLWGLEAQHPDHFLMDQFHMDLRRPGRRAPGVQAIADCSIAPPGTATDVLDAPDRCGIVETAAVLRR